MRVLVEVWVGGDLEADLYFVDIDDALGAAKTELERGYDVKIFSEKVLHATIPAVSSRP